MKQLTYTLCAIVFALAPCSARPASAATPSPSAKAAPDRPNIVYLISDDQSWTDYGFMGHPDIATPHLDRLAARSAVFPRGYVPTALCRPSLMTLATGLYAYQHKTSGNDPSPAAFPGIDKRELKNHPPYRELRARLITHVDAHPTLPRLLAGAGYLSHQSGKWWEGSFERGGFTHGMTRGFPQPGGRHGDDGLKIGRDGMEPVFGFIDHALAEEKPFLLFYAPFMPHTPHTPPTRLFEKYRKKVDSDYVAKYFAMCEWFDETCGQLIDYIDDKGLTGNTLFVYLSDNGWIQRTDARNYAPRSKQSPYEGGVRQPMLLSWPGVIEPGTRNDLVSSIDLLPTALSAAGVAAPDGLPGLDLLPLVRDGVALGRDTIFGEGCAHDIADIENPEESLLYRWCIEGKWKLLLTYDGVLNRYASSHPRSEKGPQLFDLGADPHEEENLASANPKIVARLAKKIENWYPLSERKTQLTPTP
ncbi:MAG: sulfatase-like hydrolase/transferase [Verrucomicrobiales bacterium]